MFLFTFLTVFAGGIGLETVGARIWIWPLVFNVVAFVFVYFMCPDVSIPDIYLQKMKLTREQPTNKTLEEVDALFAQDAAVLNRLNHADRGEDEKPGLQQVENAA